MDRPLEPPVFDARELAFHYDGVPALRSVSLSIRSGERIALLGANGSGKSTLLRLLDGLYFPESGSVRFQGEPLTEESLRDEAFAFAFRRKVGLVFQNPDVQLFNPTVFDEIAFGPLQLQWPRESIRARVEAALEDLDISGLRDRSPHRLSGGEKKRVAIASVLVLEPEVLLLDEPTSALDPHSHGHIVDLLAGWRGSGKTVVTATHDLDTVEEIADRAIVFRAGQVAAEGLPARILSDAALLRETGLMHAHRHTHASGETHSHPHRHHSHD